MSPSAERKLTVIEGPRSANVWISNDSEITAATSGISQTSEGTQRPRCRRSGPGIGGDGGHVGEGGRGTDASRSDMSCIQRIPQQAWVKTQRSHHGEHHHGAEGNRPAAWNNGR